MSEWQTAAQRKKILDDGGKLQDKDAEFYEQLSPAQRRLLAVLPTMIHEALAEIVEKHGGDVSPDVLHFLNISASKALMHMDHPRASAHIIQKDANSFLQVTNAHDGRQAALSACYLVLQLAEEGRIPKPEESQAVLAATAIVEEAKTDGDVKGWRLDEAKVTLGAAAIRERLEANGYIILH